MQLYLVNMVKGTTICFLTALMVLGNFSVRGEFCQSYNRPYQEEDSVIWKLAVQFTTIFNKGDTAEMSRFLPEDFMLLLLHDNFLGKKGLLKSMMDSAVHSTYKHILKMDGQTIIRYSDDHSSASINTSFGFIEPAMSESVKKEHRYGLCVMYFQKREGKWILKTDHLDLQCSLCNE